MIEITLAQNLRDFMKSEKLTQSELGKELNMSQSGISKWLLGRHEPSIASLWALADYFDCSIDELVGRKL